MHEHYIFWLDVAVQDLVFVHQTDRIQQIADDEGSALLR